MKKIDFLSVSYCMNWFSILGVEKHINHHRFGLLFSMFDCRIWVLLLLSWILLSIINTKYKNKDQNIFITLIISWINHFEVLISKSGKQLSHFLPLI